jgi:hypothetical protein
MVDQHRNFSVRGQREKRCFVLRSAADRDVLELVAKAALLEHDCDLVNRWRSLGVEFKHAASNECDLSTQPILRWGALAEDSSSVARFSATQAARREDLNVSAVMVAPPFIELYN